MSYGNAAVAYREREVLTASPTKLVVIVYDHLLANMRRAKAAIEAGNVEVRADALGKARTAVMELLVTTDVERGGELADNLRALYAFLFGELMSVGRTLEPARIERLLGIVSTLRDAFSQVAAESAAARSPAA